MPYLQADDVEQRLELAWPQYVHMNEADAATLGAQLREELAALDGDKGATQERLTRQLARLDGQRLKLVKMAYADAIPLDVLKSEQVRVAREMELTKRQLAEAENAGEATYETYEQASALMRRGAEVYALAEPEVRRQLTRAFISRLEVDAERQRLTLSSPWRELREAALRARLSQPGPRSRTYMRSGGRAAVGTGGRSKTNPGLVGQGSSMNPLVELRGFEPLTPSMRTRCATGLRYSPN